ncbi:RB-associated KRAB zinc finger protein-like [Corythoichthys intestinalis]|uniref:RB-associated KRAB zinc finger protein-like n=1 Tax=Corythoichthys intestinalis TaxID=161448 RepID=UPI0025A62EA6|nr:RB-associated KRAB zinc finger protein-like [Corythoichthys intestinalis]
MSEMLYNKQETEPETPSIKEEEQEDEITFPLTVIVKSEEDEDPSEESGAAKPSSDSLFQRLATKDVTIDDLHPEKHDPLHVKKGSKSEMPSIKQEAGPETPYIKEKQQEGEITTFPLTVIVKNEEDEAPSEVDGAAKSSSNKSLTTKGEGRPQPDSLLAQHSDSDDQTSHSSDFNTEDGSNCDQNASKSSNKSSLKRNTKECVDDKPFACSVCDKRYYTKENLTIHTRAHTGEKPFACSVCDKSYSRKNLLTRHTYTHTGEKPFPCSDCTQSFITKLELNRHARKHSGEKPYACKGCGKTFTFKATERQHFRKHHMEKPFS